jgi:hypothetical protein
MPAYWDAETRHQCLEHIARLDPTTFGVPVKVRARVMRRREHASRAAAR